MQRIHCLLVVSTKNVRQDCDGPVDGIFNPVEFIQRWPGQYEIRYIAMATRMADADTNSGKVAATESGDDITQAVVPAMTATCLESRHARLEIDFIMDDQYLLWFDSIKRRHGRNGLTAQVHECARHDDAHYLIPMLELAGVRLEFLFRGKGDPVSGLQTLHKPEPDIMPGCSVLLSRVSQPGYQGYFSGFHIDSGADRVA